MTHWPALERAFGERLDSRGVLVVVQQYASGPAIKEAGVEQLTAALQAQRVRRPDAFAKQLHDAAHRLTPAGGMGMNTGVHDVHNLAWKLAAVFGGWAGESLLKTYAAERRPVAARNVEWSLGNWECFSSGKPFPPVGAPNTEEIDLGSTYQSAAVLSDGTPLPAPSIDHIPCARPGRRAPHVWISTRGKTPVDD